MPPTFAADKEKHTLGFLPIKKFLTAIAIANNSGNQVLQNAFSAKAKEAEATDAEVAEAITQVFVEIVLAPNFEPEALQVLQTKKIFEFWK